LIQTVQVVPARTRPGYNHSTLRRFCTLALSSTLIFAAICTLITLAILPRHHGYSSPYFPWANPFPSRAWPNSDGISYHELQHVLQSTPDESKAREWSKYYTAGPHLAGKNLSQALWTRERWQEFGVKSEIVAYDVYINYPLGHRLALLKAHSGKVTSRNAVQNKAEEVGYEVKYECSMKEDILDEDPTTGLKDRIPTFHGYSASGNVTAPYVYVNFGTFHDFEDLKARNISFEGKIALVKYGRIFRGLKVKRAQELGMVGVVMYTDPQEDGEITEENGYKTYPAGPARNPSSVQRGSTQYISMHGSLFG
jgi:N-acetylated-alpha-linked acidic dipeptidase